MIINLIFITAMLLSASVHHAEEPEDLRSRAIALLEAEMYSDGQYSAEAAFALMAYEPEKASKELLKMLEQGKGGAQFMDAAADSLASRLDKKMARYAHRALNQKPPPRWAVRLASYTPEKKDLPALERFFTADYVDPGTISLLTAYSKDAVPLLGRILHRSATESCQAALVLSFLGDTSHFGEMELYGKENLCLAWNLAQLDKERGRPLMLSQLESSDQATRRMAVYAMGVLADSAYLAELRNLLSDPDSVVALNAAFSLGFYSDTSGAALLREAAQDSTSYGRNTDRLFVRMPSALVEPVFHKLLEKNQGLATARAAAAVATIKDSSSIPLLKSLLADTSVAIQRTSIEALGALKDRSSLDGIRSFLYSEDPVLKTSAMSALAALGDSSSVSVLNLMLFWEPGAYGENIWIRVPIVDALAKIGDTACVPALAVLLGKGDPYLDIRILNFFAKKASFEYLSYVEPRLDDIFPPVRIKAAGAVLAILGR